MGKRKNKHEFINDAIKIHEDKYNYSLVDYINNKTKVKIICKKHGIFEQRPDNHLKGSNCPICKNYKTSVRCKKTKNEFINDAIKTHGYKYDYSLVDYINNSIKVKIICKNHGIFEQKPNSHLNGKGCPKCAINYKLNNDTFINKSIKIHGYKYDYSLINYKNVNTKVKIICRNHGIFEQKPNLHLNGSGCPKCANNIRKTKSEFINESIKIHGDKYDYSLVNYKNANTKVKIICKNHGYFIQIPYLHLNGSGCPNCNESKGEKEIRKILENNNIIFESQKTFDKCKNKYKLRFDFYLPEYNTCIEYDGEQHYISKKYWGGLKTLEKIQLNDKIKTKFCKEYNIKLFRIRYDENIEKIYDIINND